MRNGKIIIVDDQEAVLKSLRIVLGNTFRTVVAISVPTLLPALLREGDVDLVLLDMNFGYGKQSGTEGIFWLDRILQAPGSPAVILITAYADVELAVSALKKGATDFIVKPWNNEKLLDTVIRVWDQRQKKKIVSDGKEKDRESDFIQHMIRYFFTKYARLYGKTYLSLSFSAQEKLQVLAEEHGVEELEHVVERTILLINNKDILDKEDLILMPVSSIPQALSLEAVENNLSKRFYTITKEIFLLLPPILRLAGRPFTIRLKNMI